MFIIVNTFYDVNLAILVLFRNEIRHVAQSGDIRTHGQSGPTVQNDGHTPVLRDVMCEFHIPSRLGITKGRTTPPGRAVNVEDEQRARSVGFVTLYPYSARRSIGSIVHA